MPCGPQNLQDHDASWKAGKLRSVQVGSCDSTIQDEYSKIAITGLRSKARGNSLHRDDQLGTRTDGGTELGECATSVTRGIRSSALRARVRCVLSSGTRSISLYGARRRDGGGKSQSVFHFMLDILSDEWVILSNLVLDSARASTRRRLPPSALAAP